MNPKEGFKIRFATLDDVPKLREIPGEIKKRTRFLHTAVLSERQAIILLEQDGKIEGYINVRSTGLGIKIDDFKFTGNKNQDNMLLSTVETIADEQPIYLYLGKDSDTLKFFKNSQYAEDIVTEDEIKLVKTWDKILKDRLKEEDYYKRIKEARKRYEILQPRTVFNEKMLEENLSELESKIEELKEAKPKKKQVERVMCTECDRSFETERGMKIHRTKVHGKKE